MSGMFLRETTEPEEVGEPYGKYSPIRRINLACLNCRRKKTRCSGQRPICQNCRRLSQECRYPEEIRYARPEVQRRPEVQDSNVGALADRLWNIENQLGDLSAKLDFLLKRPSTCQHGGTEHCDEVSQASSMNIHGATDNHSQRQNAIFEINESRQSIEQASFPGLLPLPVLLSTVDLYFRRCHNQPYSFFHEGNFRHRLSNGLIPDHLLFAVLATAIRFSSNSFFREQTREIAVTYANKSWKSIVSSCFTRNDAVDIMTVQTITLLAIFDFTAGHARHGSAWVKIGLSVRIAQDLRLMMDFTADLSPADQEERRRVFWSLYLLDRIVSCGRARPPAIIEASCQLQLPSDEKSWREGRRQTTGTLDQLSDKTMLNKGNLGPFALVIIMAYVLSRGAQYMLQDYNIRSRAPPWDQNSDFASISSDLLYIESELEISKPINELITEEFNEGDIIDHGTASLIVFSRALFYLCHCLLNHPFLLRHRLQTCNTRAPETFLARSFDFGRECAKRLTQSMRDAQAAGCFLNASFYGYCAVVAGSIQTLYLHSDDEGLRDEAMECIQSNLSVLGEIGKSWENVSVMCDTFTKVSGDAFRFNVLTSPHPNIPPLTLADQEIMWSLVDYSTMSSVNKGAQAYHPDFIPVNDESWQQWFNLFGS
ncbi:fungal-specific transcription factor domain-containing protein [Xylogone sp. PMI_703]|nr:fungal-specific transcription factor domain-containing protein [Xylogone sp. PMI_703]